MLCGCCCVAVVVGTDNVLLPVAVAIIALLVLNNGDAGGDGCGLVEPATPVLLLIRPLPLAVCAVVVVDLVPAWEFLLRASGGE